MSEEASTPYMERALALAARGAGFVSPNPMVGAVLVSPQGETLGEGFHQRYGGPHAEAAAVADAKEKGLEDPLRQATLVVTLEPCSHHGKTPPCADLIIDHGIPRVVGAMRDPNPKVSGGGYARLQAAGVAVTDGVCGQAARRLNEAFVRHSSSNRPLVTLKVAQTLDGRVATRSGDSRWVSSEQSRERVHRLRAEVDAVLVGTRTALADDPALTVRHSWPGRPEPDDRQPLRIVLDRKGTLSEDLRLFTDRHADRTVAIVGPGSEPAYRRSLTEAGGRIETVGEREGHLDLEEVFERLGDGSFGRVVQSVLVEAGPGLATAMLRADLIDRYVAFVTPRLLGTGIDTLADLGIDRMASARGFVEHRWEVVGPDVMFTGFMREV